MAQRELPMGAMRVHGGSRSACGGPTSTKPCPRFYDLSADTQGDDIHSGGNPQAAGL